MTINNGTPFKALLIVFFISAAVLAQTSPVLLAPANKTNLISRPKAFDGRITSAAQNTPAVDLKTVLEPSRIEETSYKVIMYAQDQNVLSKLTILDRAITRENYNSRPCIKITEINTSAAPKTKTILYIDAKTLKPVYLENSNDDVLVQKATFENGRITVTDINNGSEKTTETAVSSEPYSSNSFSELVQANDFGKNRMIEFETFSPGNPANRFKVERINEKEFEIPNGGKINCWVLKFTKTDSKGSEGPAGYRYVDKKSGKVMMFKTDLTADKFFTYQILFLK